MQEILYAFDYAKLNEFKAAFPSRHFVSIAFVFNFANNIDDLESLDAEYINNCIVDLTSIAGDTGYYNFFIERYLYALAGLFENISFSINQLCKDILLKKFPYMFDEINTEYCQEINGDNETSDPTTALNVEPIPLLLYKHPLAEEILAKYQIVSIGSFFKGTDNLNYKFNIEDISSILISKNIQYVDITQMVHTFVIRKDLVLTFEIILRQIQSRKQDIQFLICADMLEEIKKYLPFTFAIKQDFLKENSMTDLPSETKTYSDADITQIISDLNIQLKGHDDFKSDFCFNFKKFILLNRLNQRKIFSIFLTGESGIGKTEFAKILSDIMFPKQTLIKINFGNYSNEGVLNSLIGSPLGYIGSEEGGELINKMNLSSSRVILIDEFEKATPSVFHFFYELLEDGKFTDRHGLEHNLDGYIIVFTSNMTRKQYLGTVPDPLKSRFDMVYQFVELSTDEKLKFINKEAIKLIDKIKEKTCIEIQMTQINQELHSLTQYDNLRSIKRKIEDVVVAEYYKIKDCDLR